MAGGGESLRKFGETAPSDRMVCIALSESEVARIVGWARAKAPDTDGGDDVLVEYLLYTVARRSLDA